VDHAEYHGVGRRFLQFPHGGTLCALQSWWLQMDEQIIHMGEINLKTFKHGRDVFLLSSAGVV